MKLMSRRRLVVQEVATWIDVATWPVELGVATSFEVATWLVQPGGGSDVTTSSEVATWGRLPGAVHCFVHCSSHCLDTVHEHCSQGFGKKEYKNFKNFLGGNLKYEIFILKLLERR